MLATLVIKINVDHFTIAASLLGNRADALSQLATYVPDVVIHRSHTAPIPQTVHSYGVVMFADISGESERPVTAIMS